MSQIFGLSRRCHHFCLFKNQYLTKKCLLYNPLQVNQLSRYVQTDNKKKVFKERKDEGKSHREIVNLKGPYKPPDCTTEEDISSLRYHDPDTFGTLSPRFRTQLETEEMPEEADDEVSVDFVNAKGDAREHNLKYAKKIAQFIEQNKITEAFDVLDVEMKAVGARPANYIYTLLIGACGRIGNSQKAFKLYTQMRKRNLKVTAATYTGLLNACATCRDSNFALEKIDFLRDKMNKANYDMNEANYNALIKVFGRHRKVSAAFTVVDEMLEKNIRPSLSTFNFLLQACVSDSQAGFRHALMTWHKIRSKRVLPDEFSYNLLLRACRECGIGDVHATRLVIDALISPENQAILELEQRQQSGNNPPLERSTTPSQDLRIVSQLSDTDSPSDASTDHHLIHSKDESVSHRTENTMSHSTDEETHQDLNNRKLEHSMSEDEHSIDTDNTLSFEDAIGEELPDLVPGKYATSHRDGEPHSSSTENRPNLISREPHLGDIISVGEVKSAQDRLLLLGGITGVLEEMSEDLVPPSVKTFTLLLDCIPNTVDAERQLLSAMNSQRVEVDTELCNMLIKRRVFRGEMEKAKEVLDMFQEYQLQPDLITYGCLALACENYEQCQDFLEDLNNSGYRLNKEMLSAMLNQACHRCDIHYAEKVMVLFLDHEIAVDKRVLHRLSDFIRKGYRIQEARDKGLPLSTVGNLPGIVEASWWRGEFFRFSRAHRRWLSEVKVEQETPYEDQFQNKMRS